MVIRYVRIKWMTSNRCWRVFFVHWLDKYTRPSTPSKKISWFTSIIIIIILCDNYPSSIFDSPQKTKKWNKKKNKKQTGKCLFKIPLWHEIDNATSYFLISTKNLKCKQDLVFGGLNIKEGTRKRQGVLLSNHCIIGHRW